jgi:hypothetical protein
MAVNYSKHSSGIHTLKKCHIVRDISWPLSPIFSLRLTFIVLETTTKTAIGLYSPPNMVEAAAVLPPLNQRLVKNTICLFDVDGTLTPARRVRSV